MADEADNTTADLERELDLGLRIIRDRAAQIQAGVAGDCSLCGEFNKRLILGACSPCRDKHKLA